MVLVYPARDHLPGPTIKCLYLSGVVGTLECAIVQRDVTSVRLCGEPAGAVRGDLGRENEAPTVKVADITSDTTQGAIPRNSGQPRAKKTA